MKLLPIGENFSEQTSKSGILAAIGHVDLSSFFGVVSSGPPSATT